MLKKLFFLTLLVLVISSASFAKYEVTGNCLKAWEAMLDLKLVTAKTLIDDEFRQNPDNYYAYYLDQSCDAFALIINGSEEMYEQFSDDFEDRREIMDDKDTDSPYYLACKAEMYLQMSIFNVLYGDQFTGVRKGYKSYKILKDNLKVNPDFIQNKKLDGFFNIAISNLPPFVRWVVGTFGVSGESEKGFSLLHEYFNEVKTTQGLSAEAALYVLLSYKLNKEPQIAFDFIKVQDSLITKNRIIKYFYANTAYRSGHNEEALQYISRFDPDEAEIFFLPYDYMMGKILLRKLDDRAGYHLNRYAELNKKDSYRKEIYYKLGLSYLITGDVKNFKMYREKACDEGADVNERDREASCDCDLDYIPDITLAKCKLLLDGGYFERFAELFITYNLNNTTKIPFQLEYYLLKGRYEEYLGNENLALASYLKVIEKGEDEDYYFASESAMNLGLLYKDSDKEKSIKYFEMARDLYDSDYYDYIDEIAKREIKLLKD